MKCPHCGGTVLTRHDRYRKKLVASGRCSRCAGPNPSPFTTCQDCRDRFSTMRKQYRQQARQASSMLECGQEVSHD